jgi:hypothetical protein
MLMIDMDNQSGTERRWRPRRRVGAIQSTRCDATTARRERRVKELAPTRMRGDRELMRDGAGYTLSTL